MKFSNIFISLLLLVSFNYAHSQTYSSQHEKVKLRFLSKEEKPISKDAFWSAQGEFKVGVIDNGKSRDRYAQYVCEVLYEYGFKGAKIRVQIMDIEKIVYSNKWIRLGNAYCL
jgi:hypothetical protein